MVQNIRKWIAIMMHNLIFVKILIPLSNLKWSGLTHSGLLSREVQKRLKFYDLPMTKFDLFSNLQFGCMS